MRISSASQVKNPQQQSLLSKTASLQVQNPEKEFHRVDDLMNSLPESHVLFLSFLHNKSKWLDEISYSVKALTKFMDLSERQVQRIIKRLSDLNLISVKRRYHNTNVLSLSWIFECDEYKTALSMYFKKDYWYEKAVFSRARDVTLVIVDYYYKKDSIQDRGDFGVPIWHRLDPVDIANKKTSNYRPSGWGSSDNPLSRAVGRGGRSMMSKITPLNRKISTAIGFTQYGSMLLSAFPDVVLEEAYEAYTNNTETIEHTFTWLFYRCRTICETRDIEPYYSQMFREVQAAGYKPGDKLFVRSDPEAQFRYNDLPTPTLRQTDMSPGRIMKDKPVLKKEVDTCNQFLARFGIPTWAKENDSQSPSKE